MGLSIASAAILGAGAAALLVRARNLAPAGLTAFAMHLVAIAPVLAATNNGWVVAHNRYAYMTGMALAGAIAGGLIEIWRRRRKTRLATLPFLIVAVASLLFGTQARALAAEWHDRSRLWADTLSHDPDDYYAFNRLGEAYLRRGDYRAAILQFQMRLGDHPDDTHAHHRLTEYEPLLAATELNDQAITLARGGDIDGAIELFRRAISVKPDYVVPYGNLAAVLRSLNRMAEAAAYDEKARRIKPYGDR